MIGFLSGKIKDIFEDRIIVDVNNVGYEVRIPVSLLITLKEKNNISLYIHTHKNENEISLFGFENKEELELFKKLISVSGVGPKSALSVLSVVTPSTIKKCIYSGNPDLFPKIPGIGKKTIEKIILELKNSIKIDNLEEENQNMQDARLALESLGYSHRDIIAVLNKIDKNKTMNEIIKEALSVLSKN